jgi:uncharacterized membrane protein (UPF0127 family)
MAAVINTANGAIVATRVERANNPWTRGIGLLTKAAVGPDEGLWIERCSAVHTIGMRATIDLFFLDKRGKVLRIVSGAKPLRPMISCRRAATVVELGTCAASRDVSVGDVLVLS